ncbi:MAG: glycosyltransferase family 2 protein [Anaerolineae bacterium]|nr:glycosyltransferase family 2 protein [Anaerolineae bacterium]
MKGDRAEAAMIEQPNISYDNKEKPLITFVIITYNQEQFIREAVEGAFYQTYSPLEIILSDDCSPDRTFEIMEEMASNYQGPHHIILNRNDKNLGLAGHVNVVFEKARGEIIVLAAGDDISLPERAQRSWEILKDNPDYGCISFSTIKFSRTKPTINELTNNNIKLKEYDVQELETNPSFHTNGAARSIRKSVLQDFLPLMCKTPTEDSTLLLRCLIKYLAVQSNEKMVLYRVHENNIYASDNKNRINYEVIHLQYMTDLTLAYQKGLITTEQLLPIIKNLNIRLSRQNAKKELNLSKNKIIFFINNILFKEHFRLTEKYKMLMNYLSLLVIHEPIKRFFKLYRFSNIASLSRMWNSK